ncbi:hypothetical protein [Photobacterium leiognathi]|uniref:hypothetical protein n=1 Tax=Photobacterium leiognathi TaxID=553611 RepID=UPI002980A9F8|nr:hypothetical protein [Photobacterium leiognathi]
MSINNQSFYPISSIYTENKIIKPNSVNKIADLVNEKANLEEVSSTLLTLDIQPDNAEEIAMYAKQQMQVATKMVDVNRENEIAQALAKSTIDYSKKLLGIEAWTSGGGKMFSSALSLIFDNEKNNAKTSGYALENLFQLAIMDFISRGLKSTKNATITMMHFLESTGSGSHGFHENFDGEEFSHICSSIFDTLMDKSPQNSLCSEILTYINNNCNGKQALKDQYTNHYRDSDGFVCDPGYSSNSGLSPMLRTALMSAYLKKKEIKRSDVEIFLAAPIGTLNQFITANTTYTSAMEFLFDNDGYGHQKGWREVPQNDHIVIDWLGDGLDTNYFKQLYSHFPPRELTNEDVEEVNRIGDQVKIIQQTLKYWLSKCADERLAIARNI